MIPRDIAQFLTGHIGEDGAVHKAVEYAGAFIDALPVEERILFPLMAIDIGAKAGYIDPNERTLEFAKRLSKKEFTVVRNDADLEYEQIIDLDVSSMSLSERTAELSTKASSQHCSTRALAFPPGAGSNQAVNMSAMTSGEAMISTQARNSGTERKPRGRALPCAHTVAASAIEGRITDPRRCRG